MLDIAEETLSAALAEKYTRLKEVLYERLAVKWDYERLDETLTPGSIDGVTKQGIEVTGIPSPLGLIVDINVPVDAPETALYARISSGGATYLRAREKIFVTEANLEAQLDNIEALALPGIHLAEKYSDRKIEI